MPYSSNNRDEETCVLSVRLHDNRLNYIGQDIRRIPAVFVKLYATRIIALDMSFNCLNNLSELENFIYLKELILDNNQLGDNIAIPFMKYLYTFSLNNNNITDIGNFIQKVKRNTPNLKFLSLLGNKACPNQLSDISKDEEDYNRYRYYVLYHLPQLKFLDSSPVTKYELNEALIRGKYMQIRRPKESDTENVPEQQPESFNPLPLAARTSADHQGAYGKCNFRYTGAHSEGNRFIKNSDL